ncbi:MAG: hypothetical protein K2W96_25225, partial [Gemmataceae bacterium]|nr:hypothetical protein [Gemmataceae bacterium]
GKLKEFYWRAQGYSAKRLAEVLATHPSARALGKDSSGKKHPLVVQHHYGGGRCLFFGFSETWRWNWREDQQHYNRFWNEAMRYLARTKESELRLYLNKQTPYTRGEPITMYVQFPTDEKPPPEDTVVKVLVERNPPGKPADKETRTITLAHAKGSRGRWEATLTQTPEGDYRFLLSEPLPKDKERPEATATVTAPLSEMEALRMDEERMREAAERSGGKFYGLADAGRLLDEIPASNRVTVNAPGPPMVVWNSWVLFALALGLFTVEWLLRKTKNLL